MPRTPYPTPPFTHCKRVYSIRVLVHNGKGWRGSGEPERKRGATWGESTDQKLG
jgi:hypothetical protein